MFFKTTVALGNLCDIAKLTGVSLALNKPLPIPTHNPPYPQTIIRHGFYVHIMPEFGNKKLLTGQEAMIHDYDLKARPDLKGKVRTQSRYNNFLSRYILEHVQCSLNVDYSLFESHVTRWNLIYPEHGIKKDVPKFVFNPPWAEGIYSTCRLIPTGVEYQRRPEAIAHFSVCWIGQHGYVIAMGMSNNSLELVIFSEFELDLRILKALHDATDPYVFEKIFRLLGCRHYSVEQTNLELYDDDMYMQQPKKTLPSMTNGEYIVTVPSLNRPLL